jgi:hypothetical protein
MRASMWIVRVRVIVVTTRSPLVPGSTPHVTPAGTKQVMFMSEEKTDIADLAFS